MRIYRSPTFAGAVAVIVVLVVLGQGGFAHSAEDRGSDSAVASAVEYPARLVRVDDRGPLYAQSTRYSVAGSGARVSPSVRLVADTQGGCEEDGSASIQVCLTQFFRTSGQYMAVELYAVTWTRSDAQARLLRGVIRAGVLGRCLPSSCAGSLNDSEEFLQDAPVSGKTYTMKPRWAGLLVDISGDAYQRGVSELTWGRGTATYVLVHSGVGR